MTIVFIETLGDEAPARIWRAKRYTQQWLTAETKEHLAGRVGGLFEADYINGIWHIGAPHQASDALRKTTMGIISVPSPRPLHSPHRGQAQRFLLSRTS